MFGKNFIEIPELEKEFKKKTPEKNLNSKLWVKKKVGTGKFPTLNTPPLGTPLNIISSKKSPEAIISF